MNQSKIDNELRTRLDEIKSVAPRNEKQRMLGRAKFLNEAMKIEGTVSARSFLRHNRWISIGKEKLVMNAVISMILIAGLFFGGRATVNAAQDDLPGEPLYTLKTASEDFSLQFENDPEAKVARLMELAQNRIQEMSAMTEAGHIPPEAVVTRLEQHIGQALQICTSMDDATLDRTLLQVRDQLRQQDRDMDQIQLHANSDVQLLFERTRTMLQLRLRLVEDGLLNHEQFRNTVRNGQEDEQTPPTPAGENTEQNTEQNREQNNEQNGQPTSAPGGPNTESGTPSTDPGGPNVDATPGPNNDNGSGSGTGTGTESGSGGDGTGGNGSGGSGTGGSGSGGNKP